MNTFIFRVSTLRVINKNLDLDQEQREKAIRIYYNRSDEYSCPAEIVEQGYVVTSREDLLWFAKETHEQFINISIKSSEVEGLIKKIENTLKKEKLNPIFEGLLYSEYMQLSNVTQKQLAHILDKTQGAISNKIRLLNLPVKIQGAILDGRLKERHGRSILKLEKEKDFQNQALVVYLKILEKNLSVQETDDMVDELLGKEVGIRDNLNIKRVKDNKDYVLPETATIVDEIHYQLQKTLHEIKQTFPKLDIELSHGVDRKDYVFLLKLKGLNDGKDNSNN